MGVSKAGAEAIERWDLTLSDALFCFASVTGERRGSDAPTPFLAGREPFSAVDTQRACPRWKNVYSGRQQALAWQIGMRERKLKSKTKAKA